MRSVYVPNDDIRSYEPFGASSDSFSYNGGTSNIPVFPCSPCARALSARMSRAHHRRGERRAAHGIRSAHGARLWSIPTPLGLATPAPTTLAPSPSCCKPGRRRRLGAHDAIASRARPTRQMKLPAVGASSPSDGRWSRASWSSAGSLLRIVSRPKLEPALHCRRAECRCQQGAERDHAARSQREWSDMIAA